MLRVSACQYHRPATVLEAVTLMGEHEGEAMLIGEG